MFRRLTHCHVPGHGTHCAAVHEDNRFPRSTERRLALAFEEWADESLAIARETFAAQAETWPA